MIKRTDCDCFTEPELTESGFRYPITFCDVHEAAYDMHDALNAIYTALRHDKFGRYLEARALADKWNMFHDDLNEEALLAELARVAMDQRERGRLNDKTRI